MSVGVLGPAGRGIDRRRSRHERLVVLAAVLAVVGAVCWPALASLLASRPVPHPDEPDLSRVARLALDRLPGAYVVEGRVVVPAVVDPYLRRLPMVQPDEVVGRRSYLHANGLLPYGALASRRTPAWLAAASSSDRVFHDAGYLSLGCVRPASGQACRAALLAEDRGFAYLIDRRPGLLREGGVTWVSVLRDGVPGELVVGTAPRQTRRVVAVSTTAGQRRGWVDLSPPGAVGGHTVWWTTAEPRQRIEFYDARGRRLGAWNGSP